MTDRWRETFLAYAETTGYLRALEAGRRVVADALAASSRPYLAFSGGKDSLCMAHLVLEQAPDIMCLLWDFGAKLPDCVRAEVLEVASAVGIADLRVETSDEYRRYGRKASHVFEREFFGRVVPALCAEGYDGAFVGLRAEESGKRRRRIAAHQSLTPIREWWPLATWTWLDVWAYIVANSLRYVSLYDQEAEVVGYENVRFSTLFDPDMAYLGTEQLENVVHWRHRHKP